MTIETLEQIIEDNAAAADRGDEMAQMQMDWATQHLIELQKLLKQLPIENQKTIMTKTEKIAHLTKQLKEWTAMLHKSRKHSLMCMRATHVSYLQNELAKLKES